MAAFGFSNLAPGVPTTMAFGERGRTSTVASSNPAIKLEILERLVMRQNRDLVGQRLMGSASVRADFPSHTRYVALHCRTHRDHDSRHLG